MALDQAARHERIEFIRKQLANGLSLYEIGKTLGIDPIAVYRFAKRHHIEGWRKGKRDSITKSTRSKWENIFRQFTSAPTAGEVASRFNENPREVRLYARKLNFKLRASRLTPEEWRAVLAEAVRNGETATMVARRTGLGHPAVLGACNRHNVTLVKFRRE